MNTQTRSTLTPDRWRVRLKRLVRRLTRWAWADQISYYQGRLSGEPDEHMRIIAKTYNLEGMTWANVVYYLVKKHPPKSPNAPGAAAAAQNTEEPNA